MSDPSSELAAYRVLDAAINRAAEGFRVTEDLVRLDLNDGHLACELKQLRHRLTQATSELDLTTRITARDSQADVGRHIETESEYQRETGKSLVQSNLGRAQQALRTIEEFAKSVSKSTSKRAEQLRYDTYTIEKAVMTTLLSLEKIAEPCVYVLVGCDDLMPQDFGELANNLIDAGADFLQLRDKSATDRQLIAAGRTLTELTRHSECRWIMNDRPDLAVVTGADGVHLGQDDMPVGDARKIVGAAKLIGVSTHSLQQAKSAVLGGANYIGVGPVFPTMTKSFDQIAGLSLASEVAGEIKLPAFAIGGINTHNLERVAKAGIGRIAVSSAVVDKADPATAVRELKKHLTKYVHH